MVAVATRMADDDLSKAIAKNAVSESDIGKPDVANFADRPEAVMAGARATRS